MSLVLFYAGKNGYAMDCRHILSIVPQVELKKMPSTPTYIAGLLNFAGKLIPVIDFCQIIEKRSARPLFSTRIILMQDPRALTDNLPRERLLALLGEKVNDLAHLKEDHFEQSDFPLPSFPFIKRIMNYRGEIIRIVDTEEFFHSLSEHLFPFNEGDVQ